MKKLIMAFLAFTLLSSGAQAQDELESQTPVMMDIVRMILREARDGRLEQMMPRADQLRGLEGILRPDGDDHYALAEEFYRMVKPTPEQEAAMRDFRLSREQLFTMLEYVMDRGLETRPQELDQFLTRDQQVIVDNLQLSTEQIDALHTLMSQQLGPMMEGLQGRMGDVSRGVELNGAQNSLLQMLLQLIPARTQD